MVQVRLECGGAAGGEPVRAAAVLGVERLDEPALFEPAQRAVEGTRTEPHPGERLDVLHQGVPVLVAAGEAAEDQDGGVGELHRYLLRRALHRAANYTAQC